MNKEIKIRNGFTLLELLVVVLIIGILAAIALPQYKKAVLKAQLHSGVSLVESIYQAQQVYALNNGDFAYSFDDLDVSIPIDSSCTETKNTKQHQYECGWGTIKLTGNNTVVFFSATNPEMAYVHMTADRAPFEKDKRYCNARPNSPMSQAICQSMGGVYIGENPNVWFYYELK